MLIIYRTANGEIVSLDFETPAAAMDIYLAQSEHGKLMAYLETELDAESLAGLVASVQGYAARDRYRVDVAAKPAGLLDGKSPVVASKKAELLAVEIAAAKDLSELKAATLKVLGLTRSSTLSTAN